MAEQTFINGMIVKRNPNAPDFVKCSLSFKVDEFIEFAKQHGNDGWLNADVKESKNSKLYASLNDWKPDNAKPTGDGSQDDIVF